jgi:hypothetical protein
VTALPSYKYRDPLDVLISAEASTCKGCKHTDSMIAFGEKIEFCKKGRKKKSAKCYEETFGISCQGGK